MFTDPTGAVLLLRRTSAGDHEGEWSFPGGKLEEGEDAETAARREAVEELGGDHPKGDLRLWTRRIRNGVDFTTFIQRCERFEPVLNEEHDEFGWFPVDALLEARDDAEFKESEHPRGQPGNAGQFGEGGEGKKSKPRVSHKASLEVSKEHVEKLTNRRLDDKGVTEVVNTVADHLGLYGDRKITISHDEYKFILNDRECFAGGTASLDTNEITIYPDKLSAKDIAPLAAHEIMHVKFETVFKQFEKERTLLGKKFKAQSKIDEYLESHPKQFAAYRSLHKLEKSREQFIESDGITDYSREWWAEYNKNKIYPLFKSAVHETLAEMSKLDWEEVLPRLLWFKESETWGPLYEDVNQIYETQLSD